MGVAVDDLLKICELNSSHVFFRVGVSPAEHSRYEARRGQKKLERATIEASIINL